MNYYIDICNQELDVYKSDLSAFAAHASLNDIDPLSHLDVEARAPNLVFGSDGHTYKEWLEGRLGGIALHIASSSGSGKSCFLMNPFDIFKKRRAESLRTLSRRVG